MVSPGNLPATRELESKVGFRGWKVIYVARRFGSITHESSSVLAAAWLQRLHAQPAHGHPRVQLRGSPRPRYCTTEHKDGPESNGYAAGHAERHRFCAA